MAQLRVLVVDDSSVFRSLLAEAINASPHARVVAHAADGAEALKKFAEYKPDVVTTDVEMPQMSGLELLRELRKLDPDARVVVVSSLTTRGAKESMRALELGAFDVVGKPDHDDMAKNREELRARARALFAAMTPTAPPPPSIRRAPKDSILAALPKIVAIGSSTGGPAALATIVPTLPRDLPVPVVIVQHMPPVFTASLAEMLAQKSQLRVVEARHGDLVKAGTVYLAPGGKHLRVTNPGSGPRILELTEDPPENFCRPAVDYLFRSVAQVYAEQAMAVILTGMGKDGTLGLRVMKRHGVYVIGQSAESCTVYGMPREAMAAGVVDVELPAEQIGAAITAAVTAGRRS